MRTQGTGALEYYAEDCQGVTVVEFWGCFLFEKVTLAASMVFLCCAVLLESDGSKYPRPWSV